MTNFDTDTRFQQNYIEQLELEILKQCTPSTLDQFVWQPLLFYNWNLNQRGIFVRVTSLIRNMFMMGVLVPFQLNVMSIYTFSLSLCIKGNYTHPAYQMEDIICFIRWFAQSQQVYIKYLYYYYLLFIYIIYNLFITIYLLQCTYFQFIYKLYI